MPGMLETSHCNASILAIERDPAKHHVGGFEAFKLGLRRAYWREYPRIESSPTAAMMITPLAIA
jgi:hypothetical protein